METEENNIEIISNEIQLLSDEEVSSGSFETSKYGGVRGLKFNWWVNEQNVNDNYSIIGYNFVGTGTGTSYYEMLNAYLNINGSRVYTQDSNKIQLRVGTVVSSGTARIYHNDDGAKSFSADGGGGIYYFSTIQTGAGSWRLPSIPRASKFGNIPEFNVEENITLAITKYVSSWTDNLSIKIGDTVVAERDNVSNSQVITFTETELSNIFNLMSNVSRTAFTLELKTMNGSTQIGNTQTKNVNGFITNANPTLTSFDYEDCNPITIAITGNSSKIINTKSTLRISNIIANTLKGATLNLVQINGVQYNYTNDFSVDIENWNNNTITLYVIDSRNNSVKLEVLIGSNYINYTQPLVANKTVTRSNMIDETSILSVNGTWFNSSFGTSNNSLSASYKYKETGTADWIDGSTLLNLTINDNNYSIEQAIKGDTDVGFDSTKSYDIQIIISDLLTNNYQTTTLISGKPAVDIFKDNVAFGGIYDESSEFKTQFKDKVNFENGVNFKNSVNFENTAYIQEKEITTKEYVDSVSTRNIITVKTSSNLNLTVANNTLQIIPRDMVCSIVGDKLSLESNKVKIGPGVSKIKVSCSINVTNNVGSTIYFVLKNGGTTGFFLQSTINKTGNSYAITDVLLNVKENDLIFMDIENYSGSSKTVSLGNGGNFMTVEVIE